MGVYEKKKKIKGPGSSKAREWSFPHDQASKTSWGSSSLKRPAGTQTCPSVSLTGCEEDFMDRIFSLSSFCPSLLPVSHYVTYYQLDTFTP